MTETGLRLDKWLWHARFVKTRSLATRLCQNGRIRVNRQVAAKPATAVRAGDVLTFPLNGHVRVIRVLALADRRGPATEARRLYEDLAPPARPEEAAAEREAGQGRPTKRERRAIDAFTGRAS